MSQQRSELGNTPQSDDKIDSNMVVLGCQDIGGLVMLDDDKIGGPPDSVSGEGMFQLDEEITHQAERRQSLFFVATRKISTSEDKTSDPRQEVKVSTQSIIPKVISQTPPLDISLAQLKLEPEYEDDIPLPRYQSRGL